MDQLFLVGRWSWLPSALFNVLIFFFIEKQRHIAVQSTLFFLQKNFEPRSTPNYIKYIISK